MLKILQRGGKGITCLSVKSSNIQQVVFSSSLIGRKTRGGPLELKKNPIPYEKRKIWELEAMFDSTIVNTERENAKLIVVDGPIAAGKTPVAKLLAEEFDMKYIPDPTMDELLITPSGCDLRDLDELIPPSLRTYDHKNFCVDPTHANAATFQFYMLYLRCATYIDALAHILNTGQGVVIERSFYSGFAFIHAMFKENYITKEAHDHQFALGEIMDPILLRPHVVIYLDVPILAVQDRIKRRNLSYEVNGTALKPSYLEHLESFWKKEYLRYSEIDSEVLIYNWEDGGDVDLVIEDLENLNLNAIDRSDEKLDDWKWWRAEWRNLRMRYTNEKEDLLTMLLKNIYDVEAYQCDREDFDKFNEVIKNSPGYEATPGLNYKKVNNLFKLLLGINPYKPRSNRIKI